MDGIELEVAEAYPNDAGSSIARVDPDALEHLGVNPGAIVEIVGEETAAAKVWRADREDWNTDTVRIDGFTRQNADVGVGERVTVRTADAAAAERVVLALPAESTVDLADEAAGMVKRLTIKRPVRQGDLLPVMSSTNHSFMRSPGQAIPLVAVETEPDGVALVTEDTEVELREEPPGTGSADGESP